MLALWQEAGMGAGKFDGRLIRLIATNVPARKSSATMKVGR
jgi:hypothetical protein